MCHGMCSFIVEILLFELPWKFANPQIGKSHRHGIRINNIVHFEKDSDR